MDRGLKGWVGLLIDFFFFFFALAAWIAPSVAMGVNPQEGGFLQVQCLECVGSSDTGSYLLSLFWSIFS